MDINSFCLAGQAANTFRFFENLKEVSKTREVVFLCVGSSKVWYDCFGPMFGSLLKYLDIDKFVYGNLPCNITASNLQEYVDMIYKFHTSPYVVVVDNSLSGLTSRGLYVGEGPITCAAYTTEGVSVGDCHICYGFSKEDLKDSHNYYKMLKSLKVTARMLMFALDDCKNKNVSVKNI